MTEFARHERHEVSRIVEKRRVQKSFMFFVPICPGTKGTRKQKLCDNHESKKVSGFSCPTCPERHGRHEEPTVSRVTSPKKFRDFRAFVPQITAGAGMARTGRLFPYARDNKKLRSFVPFLPQLTLEENLNNGKLQLPRSSRSVVSIGIVTGTLCTTPRTISPGPRCHKSRATRFVRPHLTTTSPSRTYRQFPVVHAPEVAR